MVFFRVILGFIVSKEGKLSDPNKTQAIVNMSVPWNSQQIQMFNGMAQFYKCFIKKFAMIMALIVKLTRKKINFMWTKECQKAWELIKQKYIESPILLPPKWDVEFCVHIDASLLVMGALLAQNIIGKNDQPIVYASKLLNNVK